MEVWADDAFADPSVSMESTLEWKNKGVGVFRFLFKRTFQVSEISD